jgi:hypothetical protein
VTLADSRAMVLSSPGSLDRYFRVERNKEEVV